MFRRIIKTNAPKEPSQPPKAAAAGASPSVIAERRKIPRPLPVPEVRESNTDSAWAAFDALSGEIHAEGKSSSH